MKIAICDDMPCYVELISDKISEYNFEEDLIIKKFGSGLELIRSIKEDNKFDLILLDIKLEKENGITVAEALKHLYPDALIAFVTSYNSYYYKAAHVGPFDFLRKPIKKEELFKLLDRVVELMKLKKRKYYCIRLKECHQLIDLNEVEFFVSKHRTVTVYLIDGTNYTFYEKLDNIEDKAKSINPFLVRVNKSYIVNVVHLKQWTRRSVIINNMETRISKDNLAEFIEKLHTAIQL